MKNSTKLIATPARGELPTRNFRSSHGMDFGLQNGRTHAETLKSRSRPVCRVIENRSSVPKPEDIFCSKSVILDCFHIDMETEIMIFSINRRAPGGGGSRRNLSMGTCTYPLPLNAGGIGPDRVGK